MKKLMDAICGLVTLYFAVALVGCSGSTAQKLDIYEELSDTALSKIDLSKGYVFGDPNSPVTIVEYSSYECKDCVDLHDNISEKLQKYVDKGVVRYVFKPVDHPKFENDLEINLRFMPQSILDIASIFKKFDLYAHEDVQTLENVLNLAEQPYEFALAINQAIGEETNSLGISKTPTLIVNNREYTEVVFTDREFEDLIRQINDQR